MTRQFKDFQKLDNSASTTTPAKKSDDSYGYLGRSDKNHKAKAKSPISPQTK